LAYADGLDAEQPFYVGIPAWLRLSQSDSFGRNYFIVRVTEAMDDVDENYLIQGPCSVGSSVTPVTSSDTATATPATSNGTANGADKLMMLLDSAGEHAAASAADKNASGRNHLKSLDGGDSGSRSSAGSRVGGSGGRNGEGKMQQQQQRRRRQRVSLDDSAQMLQKIQGAPWLPRAGAGVEMTPPIVGLVMGPLVGKGGYGRIYRGIYQGLPVAVKVSRRVWVRRRNSWGGGKCWACDCEPSHVNLRFLRRSLWLRAQNALHKLTRVALSSWCN
jgi:hypothetical protein